METYTIIKNDTLWNIAARYGITLNELLNANPHITNPNLIYPGQQLNIPSSSSSTYTVMPGDTLWNISNAYGFKLDELMLVNPQILNSNLIYPNQVINMPYISNNQTTSSDIEGLENEVVSLVNTERRKAGVSELIQNNNVNRVARVKSQDFVNNNYFSHNSPTYGSPFDMLRTFGISFSAGAENIASGQRNPEEVMRFWMNSPGHKANILNSSYNQIGVGVAKDSSGNLYWTQMFIKS